MKLFHKHFENALYALLRHILSLLQWPSLVEVAETRQLPPMLIER